MCGSETGFSEITPAKSASIRQPHWHRHLDVKRPTRAIQELRHVDATSTERRLYDQVDCVSGLHRPSDQKRPYMVRAINKYASPRRLDFGWCNGGISPM